MTEKRRCENCGAFLSPEDKICYVCGEVQPLVPTENEAPEKPAQAPAPEIAEDKPPVELPAPEEIAPETPGEEPEPESEPEPREKRTRAKKSSKKPLIITLVCVLIIAVLAGVVCLSLFTGKFLPENIDPKTEVKIYFDCPNSSKPLTAVDGTIYYWTGDVEISYDFGGKTNTKECSVSTDAEHLWETKIPRGSENVFFYQNLNKNIRTKKLPAIKEDNVYYVTKAELDKNLMLSVGFCDRDAFSNLGINAVVPKQKVDPTEATKPEPTQKVTEAPTDPSDPDKPDDGKLYTVGYIPDSWMESVFHIDDEKGGAVYYEQTNYEQNGLGILMSIYIYDAGDSSYKDLSDVKKEIDLSDGRKIVVTTPADVQHGDDEESTVAYRKQSAYVNDVIASIQAK